MGVFVLKRGLRILIRAPEMPFSVPRNAIFGTPKWPKITFRGPILIPEVSFWGFWGLVCIEKWSQNFDSGTRNAIFGTAVFPIFGGTENGISSARIKILRPLFKIK